MVIHNDDVALCGAAVHLRDKAAVPLLAFLSGTALGTGVELLPKLGVFRKPFQLGAITALGRSFPFGDLAVLLNLLQPAQNRLVGEIVTLLPAKVVIGAFHVANTQFTH